MMMVTTTMTMIMILMMRMMILLLSFIGESGCFYNNLSDNGTTSIKADYNPAQYYHHIPGGCKIANGMGIAVLISTLLTIAAVIARNQVKDGGESDVIVASQL